MRGGLKLADRGVIPRLLSGVYRRAKKIVKDTNGETSVDVALSYYEIYNDKVFDLLEPPEKRTPTGLPLREKDGKTQVVGLVERTCQDLRDFERLYIEANNNRVTAATKLNAHSSRSHAILRVKVTQTSSDGRVRESTVSAIDLAGSEDNRRTDNGKERLVESAAINKSLFVLSQCIDAISRGDRRIPYRESKMTRILSLGQNNGITIMILNLAPLRSYHLDTLSSLNVSSRAKRIEVREIENEVVFRQPPRTGTGSSGFSISSGASTSAGMQRQPLRPLANAHNVHTGTMAANKAADISKPVKAFSVYSDKTKPITAFHDRPSGPTTAARSDIRRSNSNKRPSDSDLSARPTKLARPTVTAPPTTFASNKITISADDLEAIVEKKVSEILAARTAAAAVVAPTPAPPATAITDNTAAHREAHQISAEVQRRLEALERRIEVAQGLEEGRSDGLQYLLQARRHKESGDDEAALRLYEKALPFFPNQQKLRGKIDKLRKKIAARTAEEAPQDKPVLELAKSASKRRPRRATAGSDRSHAADLDDASYREGSEADDDASFVMGGASTKSRPAKQRPVTRRSLALAATVVEPAADVVEHDDNDLPTTPASKELLDIVNSRDVERIRQLRGFGAKKARELVAFLAMVDAESGDAERGISEGGCDGSGMSLSLGRMESIAQLARVPGVGERLVEKAREGLRAAAVGAV